MKKLLHIPSARRIDTIYLFEHGSFTDSSLTASKYLDILEVREYPEDHYHLCWGPQHLALWLFVAHPSIYRRLADRCNSESALFEHFTIVEVEE